MVFWSGEGGGGGVGGGPERAVGLWGAGERELLGRGEGWCCHVAYERGVAAAVKGVRSEAFGADAGVKDNRRIGFTPVFC